MNNKDYIRTIQMKLHPQWGNWSGHCQVTYVSRNHLGQRLVYCLQDNGANFGGIRLMRCSQDGEPSHEVKFTTVPVYFEKLTGDSRLEKLCNEWIEKREGGIA